MVPADPVPGPVAVHELQLGDPVELAGQAHRIVAERHQRRLPPVEHIGGEVVHVAGEAFLGVLAGELHVFHLDLDGGELPAVSQLDQMAAGRVVRDRAQLGDGTVDAQVGGQEPVLDHRQHQRRRAQLEVGGQLAHIGVAEDHVQPAVLFGIRVRLVTGIDDRPLQRRLQAHLDFEEVGSLADLEAFLPAVGAAPHPAGPADDLPGDEERREKPDDLREWRRATHQVVFVAAVGCALIVGVVLVELDGRGTGNRAGLGGCLLHHPLARLVPQDGRQRLGAFRTRVLRVRVIHVEPGTIGQNDVRQPEILVSELAGVRCVPGQVKAPRVAQRVLLLEVPARPPGLSGSRRVIGVDHLG